MRQHDPPGGLAEEDGLLSGAGDLVVDELVERDGTVHEVGFR